MKHNEFNNKVVNQHFHYEKYKRLSINSSVLSLVVDNYTYSATTCSIDTYKEIILSSTQLKQYE